MMRSWSGIFAILMCLVGSAFALAQGQKPPAKSAPPKKPSVPVKDEGWRILYGSPKAKVKVEAFYPIRVAGGESHEWVKDFARKLVEAFPDKVHAIVYDFTSEKGGVEWQKRGLTCGAFLINGKTQINYKGKTFVNPFLRKMATLTSPMAHAFGSPNPTLTPGLAKSARERMPLGLPLRTKMTGTK